MTLSTAFPSNGIDAATGDYLLLPGSLPDLAVVAENWLPRGGDAAELRARRRRRTERFYAPVHGVDVHDLAQTGWAAVFAVDADPAVREALRPLLEHRREAVGAHSAGRYRELAGAAGYRAGETKQAFLRRLGIGSAPVDPDVLPYYLLLVGPPEEIPFEVQYQLGVQYAVGRIAFDDVDAYRRYAANVLAAERTVPKGGAVHLGLFAPLHRDDGSTAASTEHLVAPLAAAFGNQPGTWRTTTACATDATKERLADLLATPDGPDILLAVGHGLGLPAGHVAQRRRQGALLCQDWPGPGTGPVEDRHSFGADDVARLDEADLTGLITVLVACFGGGTPRHDGIRGRTAPSDVLAPRPFVAALPQALLGREGGALAAVAHVDRVWSYSFLWPGAGTQTAMFRSVLAALHDGRPVGSALEYVSGRYAELAADLSGVLTEREQGRRVPDQTVAELWAACADARSFLLLGDPAVRSPMATGSPRQSPQRETIAVPAPRQAPAEPSPSQPEPSPRACSAVEVVTYVTDDPAGVAYDPTTGRITGAVPVVFSHVDREGRAAHAVRTPEVGSGPVGPAEQKAVVELHARLVAVSLEQAAAGAETGGKGDNR